MDIREGRKALGWSRAELAQRAQVDPRIVQLIELGEWSDREAILKCEEVVAIALGVGANGSPGTRRPDDP